MQPLLVNYHGCKYVHQHMFNDHDSISTNILCVTVHVLARLEYIYINCECNFLLSKLELIYTALCVCIFEY